MILETNLPEDALVTSETVSTHPELLDLIPRLRLLPGENALAFEHLRQAFLLDLAPATPYQTALAENLVALEWEIHRYRTLRDGLVRTHYREIAQGTWKMEKIIHYSIPGPPSEDSKAFANALMSRESDGSGFAFDWLAERNIDPGELVSAAYQNANRALAPLERILAELEVRRRRLREDYDRVQSACARPIEDAELLD